MTYIVKLAVLDIVAARGIHVSQTHLFHFRFSDLYKKYYEEVYPAKIVFVSFIPQTNPGQMVSELKEMGFDPLQFKFDLQKPDLSKLDNLFALLSMDNVSFEDELKAIEAAILERGVKEVFQEIAQG